jgi:hypothetical protein
MAKVYLLICALFIGGYGMLQAQNLPSNIGAQASGMGGTGVAADGFWAAANNQAALGFNDQWGAGFYYENRYDLKELSLNAISAVIPITKGSFGINFSSFGYSQYSERKYALAYGLALSPRLALGVQLDYLQTSIGNNYGKTGALTFEVGLMAKITDDITLGAHVFNPIQVEIADYNQERILPLMKLGAQWKLDKKFTAAAEIQSDIEHDLVLRGGLEYQIIDVLYTRIGISNNPNIFSFGVGFKWTDIYLDFSYAMHQVLGFTPQVSVVYRKHN